MAGQRRLHRHVGGIVVADLAHHDDVRILSQQRAHAVGEIDVDDRLHLHLIERGLDHFDRVLDRADVHFGRRNAFERRVKRRGLAGSSGTGDENDAVRFARHLFPSRAIVGGES